MTSLALTLVLAAGGLGQDSWSEVADMEPGPERGRLVAGLLALHEGELGREAQGLAFEAGSRAADALELDLALTIQGDLHRLVGAWWSGFNLALTQQRSGDVAAGDATLAALLEAARPGDRASLWNQRAIFALGEGRWLDAHAGFGRAMALGSADATAILAREHLARHNLHSARTGFRAALNRNPDHPWALRGWGLTVLSAPQPREERLP